MHFSNLTHSLPDLSSKYNFKIIRIYDLAHWCTAGVSSVQSNKFLSIIKLIYFITLLLPSLLNFVVETENSFIIFLILWRRLLMMIWDCSQWSSSLNWKMIENYESTPCYSSSQLPSSVSNIETRIPRHLPSLLTSLFQSKLCWTMNNGRCRNISFQMNWSWSCVVWWCVTASQYCDLPEFQDYFEGQDQHLPQLLLR